MADGELEREHGADVQRDVRALDHVVAAGVVRGLDVHGVSAGAAVQHGAGPVVAGDAGGRGVGRHRDAAHAGLGEASPGSAAARPARAAEVAGHGLQGDREAHGLLAAQRALEGEPGNECDRPVARPGARQRADARRRHAAHAGGPLRGRRRAARRSGRGATGRRDLRAAVAGVEPDDTTAQGLIAGGVRGDEGLVDGATDDQLVQQRQHEGAVGARQHRQPLRAEQARSRRAARVDDHHRHAPPPRLAHARAPLRPHDAVHQVGAPEHDHRRVTQRRRVDARVLRAQHHRLGEARGRRAVRGGLLHVPAAQIEVAGGEVVGVVQRAATRARPAERQDRGVAVTLAHARETIGDELDRLVPARLAEAARAPRPSAYQRAGQPVRGLLLPPGLEPAYASLEVRGTRGVVRDPRHAAVRHGGEQRAPASTVEVAGHRYDRASRHRPRSPPSSSSRRVVFRAAAVSRGYRTKRDGAVSDRPRPRRKPSNACSRHTLPIYEL